MRAVHWNVRKSRRAMRRALNSTAEVLVFSEVGDQYQWLRGAAKRRRFTCYLQNPRTIAGRNVVVCVRGKADEWGWELASHGTTPGGWNHSRYLVWVRKRNVVVVGGHLTPARNSAGHTANEVGKTRWVALVWQMRQRGLQVLSLGDLNRKTNRVTEVLAAHHNPAGHDVRGAKGIDHAFWTSGLRPSRWARGRRSWRTVWPGSKWGSDHDGGMYNFAE